MDLFRFFAACKKFIRYFQKIAVLYFFLENYEVVSKAKQFSKVTYIKRMFKEKKQFKFDK